MQMFVAHSPMEVITPGEKKYFTTTTDDYSRYTEVYLLQYKSEVKDKIKDYVSSVKTLFGRPPKKIRSDNGGDMSTPSSETT